MTKEDIKEALETCILGYCTGCPYDGCDGDCRDELHKDALNIITEQENEIDRLKAKDEETCLKCIESKHATAEEYAKLQEEFANYQLASDKEIMAQRKQAKIDVLNELKVRHDYAIKYMGYPWDISQQSDELIEEVENASSKGTY